MDLAGHVITNEPAFSTTAATGTRTFNLLNGTKLTVIDSSEAGTGGITTTARIFRVNTGTTLNIEGGNFSCTTEGNNLVFWNTGTIVVSGGTFSQTPNSYLAAGYASTLVDGMYVVSDAHVTVTTLDELKTNIAAGNSIRLGADIDYTVGAGVTFPVGKMALDLNGFSITVNNANPTDRMFALTANKTAVTNLTIRDSSAKKTGAIINQSSPANNGANIFRINQNGTGGDAILNIEGGNFICKTASCGTVVP